MSVPGYQEFMYPFLELLKDGKEHTLQSIYQEMAVYFNLTEKEINKKLPSGKQTVFQNRVGWARTYLSKAGLINVVRRAVFTLTEEGHKVLNNPNITSINNKFLNRYDSFIQFKMGTQKQTGTEEATNDEEQTPLELIEVNYNVLKQDLQEALLDKILECSPSFFEQLIVRLLVSMGYGGSVTDAGD